MQWVLAVRRDGGLTNRREQEIEVADVNVKSLSPRRAVAGQSVTCQIALNRYPP